MALTATVYHWKITLSDVERNLYESLDLRLARHPSESMRYLVTRAIAYCLSYERGIGFSKGGVSSTDEAPISIRDVTGKLLAWIEIGTPSAERLHKAAKLAERVALFTVSEPSSLRREAENGNIYRAEQISVYRVDAELVSALETSLQRNERFEVVRSDGQLYVTLGAATLVGSLEHSTLL